MATFIGNHTQRHANLNPPMRQFLLTGVYSQSFRVCCPGAAHDPQGDYQLSEKSKKVRTFKGFGWCCWQSGANQSPLRSPCLLGNVQGNRPTNGRPEPPLGPRSRTAAATYNHFPCVREQGIYPAGVGNFGSPSRKMERSLSFAERLGSL